MEIKRDLYLTRLVNSRQNGLIKVVTGIRRCGKSYLLFNLFHDLLKSEGVDDRHLIEVKLDDWENRTLCNPDELYKYVKSLITDDGLYYIILDEIQLVPQFEFVLNGFLNFRNVDIYVTGSNARFLSKDVITEFRGRGDEIRIYPLNFREYMSVSADTQEISLEKYLTYGGLPYIMSVTTEEQKTKYLKSLFTETYLRDIKERYDIRRDEVLRELVSILASNIGGLTSPLTLSNTFASVKKVNITDDTISKYIDYLCDAFLIERSERYDVKGKKYIGSPMKYYFSDLGLRNASINFRQGEKTHLMENAVYNELRVRGFNVDVGIVPARKTQDDGSRKLVSYEVDFVCNLGSRRYYVQSAWRLPSEEKIRQEKSSLTHIDDSFKKIIVLGEPSLIHRDDNGITTMSIYDFLLNEDSLDL